MNTYLLNQITIFIIAIVSFILAFWVLNSSPKNKVNQYFSLTIVSYIAWISFYYFMRLQSQISSAGLLARLGFAGVLIFTTFLYLFSVNFLNEEKRFSFLNKIVVSVGVIFSILAIPTNLIMKRIEMTKWGPNPVLSMEGKIIFFGFVFLVCIFILALLFKKYFQTTNLKEKLKIQYILLGFFFLIMLNFAFNIFFPLILGNFQYSYFGNYSFIILIGFTAYAIIKKDLFDIKIVLTEILVGGIALLLLIQDLTSKTAIEYVWKTIILVAFIFLGHSLIKGVLREIKLREELENAYLELKKLDIAKSEFISITSHQLRTPLTAIKGYISLILDGSYGPISEQVREKMTNVFQSNERLIKLINDVLDFSRIETGRFEMHMGKVDVEEVISSAVDFLKIGAENKKLYLRWKRPEKPLPKVLADEEKTRHAILNLIDNGIKYTEKGGIMIKVTEEERFLLIEISDTGAGMTKEEILKLFKSFSRGEAGSQFFTEGVGLGLYIAKKFIELQGGEVWAESEGKGKGSAFYIKLPIK